MKNSLYDGIFYLSQATSLDELTRTFERIIAQYGFDLFAMQTTTNRNVDKKSDPRIIGTFAKEWVSHYTESEYHTIDPVILLGKEKRKPYLWSKLWDEVEMTPLQRHFFNEAEEFGVASGVGLPIFEVRNEPGIISLVSSGCKTKEVAQIMKEEHASLSFLSASFHHAANQFFELEPYKGTPSLTARERECLNWAAEGKSDPEIGLILNISHRTVNGHMRKVYEKLDCASREQAVAKALLWRLISISV